jgi:hypothetical protein
VFQQFSEASVTTSTNTTPALGAPSTPYRIRSWGEAARTAYVAVRPAGLVTGSVCRVLLMGVRVFERWLAERQVFGVLHSHRTLGFDRTPQQVPITTAILSAMAASRLEAALSMVARVSSVVLRRGTGRCIVSCTHINSYFRFRSGASISPGHHYRVIRHGHLSA